LRHTGILSGRLWVTRCNRHVTVIPTPLALTTVRNITGHMVLGRVVKLSGDASTRAGLAVPAGRRRRRRRRSRHALTFHRCNVLLKTPAETPAGLSGFLGVSWGGGPLA